MLKINFEAPSTMMEVALEPEHEQTKSSIFDDPEARELLKARIQIGQPILEALTEENLKEDDDLRCFVRSKAGEYQYHLLKLLPTFKANPDEPFDRAWLSVLLNTDDSAVTDRPIAWSMSPQRLFESSQVKRNFALGPKLKISILNIGTLDLNTSAEETRNFDLRSVTLDALNEGCSDPTWEFSRCYKKEISGEYWLTMVIRSIPQFPAYCNIELKALVKRNKFGILPYRALFKDKQPSLLVPLI